MASQPPEQPPESIITGQWRGIRNTIAPERLSAEELEAAVNVDIDDAGQARRRRGFALRAAGDFHSVKNIGGTVYGVKNGYLGVIGTDHTFQQITYVGPDRLSYASVADTIYYSSRTASGKVVDNTALPWGAVDGEDTWLSPVVNPTEYLGAIGGKIIGAPPMATEIAAYKGRIYLAHGRTIWATELYLYDYVDKTRNFIQLEADVTMLAPVGDGIYIGAEDGLYFLQGTFSEGQRLTKVVDAAPVRGSCAYVPASHLQGITREGVTAEGDIPVCLTPLGVIAGFDGGQAFNITQGKVVFPEAVSAAAMYREDIGTTSYVAALNTGGTPTANTRIGDYVDAEIRRFTPPQVNYSSMVGTAQGAGLAAGGGSS